MNNLIDKIMTEWSYLVHDGTPNPKNPLHIVQLRESMQNLNIDSEITELLIENLLNETENTISDKVKKKAKKMGLVWKQSCYGEKDKEGCTHKVDGDKLVPYSDEEESDDSGSSEKTAEQGIVVQGGDISHPFPQQKEKDAEEQLEKERQAKIEKIEPKGLRTILNKDTAGYRNNKQYLNDDQEEVYDDLLNDIIGISLMEEGPEKQKLARIMVDKYGLERNSSGTKVYVKGLSYEARKILGMGNKKGTSGVDAIRDTIENALGEPLPGEVKAKDPKQIVTNTSKPELGKESIVHQDDDSPVGEMIKNIFSAKIFEGLPDATKQMFVPTDSKTGEPLVPSNEHSLETLKFSVKNNQSIQKTIDVLENELEGEGVSPKIRESMTAHKDRMNNLINGEDPPGLEVPSDEARDYVKNSYAKMAEECYAESPSLTNGMMKNLAEMALYDSEIAGGDECYLPSDGSFPGGDKIKKEMGNSGVERVSSVSVKWGSTGKYGSFGFPGECGQYQKYHPDQSYRDRMHSRPGDDGYDLGVKDELIDNDTEMNKLFEESGLADCMTDRDGAINAIREMKNYVSSEKNRIGYVQNAAQAKKQGKPTAKNQMIGIRKGIRAKNKELGQQLAKSVDYDCMRKNLGKDNADLMTGGPLELINGLTMCGTLKTSNGLPALEHNHQEIKDGKMVMETEKGSTNPKLWKFSFRAFDDRGGGLLASYNGNRIKYDMEEV